MLLHRLCVYPIVDEAGEVQETFERGGFFYDKTRRITAELSLGDETRQKWPRRVTSFGAFDSTCSHYNMVWNKGSMVSSNRNDEIRIYYMLYRDHCLVSLHHSNHVQKTSTTFPIKQTKPEYCQCHEIRRPEICTRPLHGLHAHLLVTGSARQGCIPCLLSIVIMKPRFQSIQGIAHNYYQSSIELPLNISHSWLYRDDCNHEVNSFSLHPIATLDTTLEFFYHPHFHHDYFREHCGFHYRRKSRQVLPRALLGPS